MISTIDFSLGFLGQFNSIYVLTIWHAFGTLASEKNPSREEGFDGQQTAR